MKDLSCLRYTDESGDKQVVHIVDDVASQWKRLGLALNCADSDLNNIERNCSQVEDCCRELFSRWLNGRIGGEEPRTWKVLVKAMKDARCGETSRKVKDIVSKTGMINFLVTIMLNNYYYFTYR